MIHNTPTKALLATTLQPLVGQLSGSLAPGARLMNQCLHQEPTPQQMARCEQDLWGLLRAVGRRIMAWVLHHRESDAADEAPSRLWWKGQAYRRRRIGPKALRVGNRQRSLLGTERLHPSEGRDWQPRAERRRIEISLRKPREHVL